MGTRDRRHRMPRRSQPVSRFRRGSVDRGGRWLSLEPKVNAHPSHESADVVADGRDAEMEVVGDLLGRAALLKQPQDLALARREFRVRRDRRLLLHMLDLAEDADHLAAAFERNSALSSAVKRSPSASRRTP